MGNEYLLFLRCDASLVDCAALSPEGRLLVSDSGLTSLSEAPSISSLHFVKEPEDAVIAQILAHKDDPKPGLFRSPPIASR